MFQDLEKMVYGQQDVGNFNSDKCNAICDNYFVMLHVIGVMCRNGRFTGMGVVVASGKVQEGTKSPYMVW